jgi:hypothetical protein
MHNPRLQCLMLVVAPTNDEVGNKSADGLWRAMGIVCCLGLLNGYWIVGSCCCNVAMQEVK